MPARTVRTVLPALLALVLQAGNEAAAQPLSLRQGAIVCERRLTVELEAASVDLFTEQAVGPMVQEARSRASCDEARSVVVKGYTGNRLVYQAIARAPRWSLRSTPILSGSEAVARAAPQRPDPAALPPVNGYRLTPVAERGSDCAQRMYFGLVGPAPMTDDNQAYVDAVAALADSAVEACPQVTSLILQLPKNSGSRMSFFTVSKAKEWLPPAVYAHLRDARMKEYQSEHAAQKNRTLPGPDTPNPLGDKGYFASRELGRGIDFTLYEAWDQQRDYDDPGELIVVHDARPASAAIVPLRYDQRRQQYQVGQVFIDELNDVLKASGYRLLKIGGTRHYMQGVTRPVARIVSASNTPQLELPLFTALFEQQKTAIYTVPQIGLGRTLDVVNGVAPHGVMLARGLFKGDARGADNVLTLGEVEASE